MNDIVQKMNNLFIIKIDYICFAKIQISLANHKLFLKKVRILTNGYTKEIVFFIFTRIMCIFAQLVITIKNEMI